MERFIVCQGTTPEVGARVRSCSWRSCRSSLVVLWFGGDDYQGIFVGLAAPRSVVGGLSALERAMTSATGLFIVGVLVMLYHRHRRAGAAHLRLPSSTAGTRRSEARGSSAPAAASEESLDRAPDEAVLHVVAALDRSGVAETLVDGGRYTVFAPSDEAFAQASRRRRRLPADLAGNTRRRPDLPRRHGRMTAAEVATREVGADGPGRGPAGPYDGAIVSRCARR